jgi:hypothetical protein
MCSSWRRSLRRLHDRTQEEETNLFYPTHRHGTIRAANSTRRGSTGSSTRNPGTAQLKVVLAEGSLLMEPMSSYDANFLE